MKDFVVLQNDISDCGACSLSSIIKYYDGYVPLEVIKVDTLTTSEGTTFYNIKQAAIRYGFEVNGFNSVNVRGYKCPFIVQLKINNMYHFVVVYEVLDKYILCMDPAVGMKKYTYDEFKKIFTGNILKLEPINQILRYKKNNHLKNIMLNIIKNNKISLCIILVLSIIAIGMSLLNTYNIKLILNNNNYKLILIFIGIMFTKNILNYIKNIFLAHLNKNNNIDLIKDYISHFFFLPFKYLQLKTSGEIISRIKDLNNIKDLFTKEIINFLIATIILVTTLIVMFYLNYKLTILLFIISIIFLLLYYILNKKCFNYYLKCLDSYGILMDNIIEDINGIVTIKNLGKEKYFLNKLNISIELDCINSFMLDKYLNSLNLISNMFNDLCLILIILISINSSGVDILIYILYYNYYIDNINYYANLIPNISYFKSIISKLNEIYYLDKEDLNTGLKIAKNTINIKNLNYNINLNNIFNNFNLTINDNDKVLIKGKNGTGKTTLLNILNGNITDYKGSISINNTNLNIINKKELKKMILYCGKKDILFTDTIMNNIILDNKYDDKRFKKIESILSLKDIVNKKSNGYNTIVKDNLSGGEYQRIILARALYSDSKILCLDESLSEINYHLRNKIIKRINTYYKNKTIIYVSHNLEENYFDKIINLTARKE